MSGFAEYDDYDALGLAELVRNSEVSAAELLDEAIARCDRINPEINAVVHDMFEIARDTVKTKLPEGPFSGVPFLLKDLGQAWAGVPMRIGSRYYKDYVPDYDAEIVNRFRDAGLVTFGKTNTPELGLVGTTEPELFGATLNPWDLSRTAGGSSGGAGAAVAAGIVPMAGASDGGGSIRIPASCNGLVGLKPSRGRNPSGPIAGEGWYGQVQEGVLSRSVRDTAAALDATVGADVGTLNSAPLPARPFSEEVGRDAGPLRIGVCREALLSDAPLDAECVRGLDATVATLEDLGHSVQDAVPPIDKMTLATGFLLRVAACTGAEVATARKEIGRKPGADDFELETRALANLGKCFTAVDLTLAHRVIEIEVRKIGRFMQDYDVLLTPTLATPPAPLGVFKARGADLVLAKVSSRVPLGPIAKFGKALEQLANNNFRFVVSTPIANMTGEPAISLPLHWSADGLPVGMMFTAKIYEDDLLFRLAAQLETAMPWRARRAPHHA